MKTVVGRELAGVEVVGGQGQWDVGTRENDRRGDKSLDNGRIMPL